MRQPAQGFQDAIVWATKAPPRRREDALLDADYHLERLKLYNRLALPLRLSSLGQHGYLALVVEDRTLLGNALCLVDWGS